MILVNFTKPGLRVAAAIAAVHLAHFATVDWQATEDKPSAAPVRMDVVEQPTRFDSETPQQEGGHRESSTETSGNGAAHVTLTPAVARFEAVPVIPEVPAAA